MTLLLMALLLLTAGGLFALLTGRHSLLASLAGSVTAAGAGLLAALAALRILQSGRELFWQAPWTVPAGSLALHLDPLAAWFVAPIALLGAGCAVYGAAYLREEGRHRSLAPHWFFYNLMVAAMLLVVTAANAVLFLAAWELMTLASFFLVAWEHHRPEVRQAAWLYLLAAHCGMMLLLALFVQAGVRCGGFDFSGFAPLAQLSAPAAAAFFLLALFGFGVKAGLLPVHIWLPDAHPAAPSHVSALMSGALVKTALYGILRILTLLPPAPAWWGWLLALLGAGGALYGIALAAQQRDLKRCLAYSTIENVGIIALGLGLGLVATAGGERTIALLAFAGALLHIWNHALFKGLMFLGAGTLVHAAGSRNMNRMGGLLRRMPLAGLLWIGGSLAISALPPFNGLVSEWLIYLGLLHAGTTGTGFTALLPLLLVGALAVVGGLALLTFSRLIGVCLLGEPRTDGAAGAHEAPLLMLLPMALFFSGCLAIGLRPGWVLRLLGRPLALLAGVGPLDPLQAALPLGTWGGLLLVTLCAVGLLLFYLRRHRPLASAATWGCGFRFPSARMAYTADACSELLIHQVLPAALHPEISGVAVRGIFPAAATLQLESPDPVLENLFQPLGSWVADRSQRLRWLQQGRLPIYLLYMFAACTLLMAWALWAGRGG
jgi:hydrogenase-4 component B